MKSFISILKRRDLPSEIIDKYPNVTRVIEQSYMCKVLTRAIYVRLEVLPERPNGEMMIVFRGRACRFNYEYKKMSDEFIQEILRFDVENVPMDEDLEDCL